MGRIQRSRGREQRLDTIRQAYALLYWKCLQDKELKSEVEALKEQQLKVKALIRKNAGRKIARFIFEHYIMPKRLFDQ